MVIKLQFKLSEPPAFNGGKKEGKSWFLQIQRYFSTVRLSQEEHNDSAQMCSIAVSLLRSNAAKRFAKLEKFDQQPVTFQGF